PRSRHTVRASCHDLQPVVKVRLHSAGDASPLTALLLAQIFPIFSVVAPCQRGASPPSVRRWTFTTGCYQPAASGESHHEDTEGELERQLAAPCNRRRRPDVFERDRRVEKEQRRAEGNRA